MGQAMSKSEEKGEAVNKIVLAASQLIDNPGYQIGTVLTNAEYDSAADQFKEALIEELTLAGQIAEVDRFFLSLIRDNYRVYIGIRDRIHGAYSEADRFGTDKAHHLLSEYRAFGKILNDNLRDCGATPKSRDLQGGHSVKVPHGNSKKSSVLDIINRG